MKRLIFSAVITAVTLTSTVAFAQVPVGGWKYTSTNPDGRALWTATRNNACMVVYNMSGKDVVSFVTVKGKKGDTTTVDGNARLGECH